MLAALIAILAPAVKLVVDLSSAGARRVVVKERQCRPVAPRGEAHRW